MPESPLIEKEIAVLAALEALVADRAKGQSETELLFLRRREKEEHEYKSAARQLSTRYKSEKAALEADYQRARGEIVQRFEKETQAITTEYAQVKQKIESQHKTERVRARKAQEEMHWQSMAVFEAGRDGTVKTRKQHEERLAAVRADFQTIQDAADPVLIRCKKYAGPDPGVRPASWTHQNLPGPDVDPDLIDPGVAARFTTLHDDVKRADKELLALEKQWLPGLLEPKNFVLPFLILGIVLVVGLGLAIGWIVGAIAGLVIVLVLGAGSHIGLSRLARLLVGRHYYPLVQALEDADRLLDRTERWIRYEFDRGQKEIEETRESEVKNADDTHARKLAEADARKQSALQEADVSYPAKLADLAQQRDAELKAADLEYPPRIKSLEEQFTHDARQLQKSYKTKRNTTKQQYEQAWDLLIRMWTEGLARVGSLAGEIKEQSSRRFLDWQNTSVEQWTPPSEVPPALRLGTFAVELSDFPGGVPTDPRLCSAGPNRLELPALIPFPIQASVLIRTGESGKAEAIKLLQALMLRFLTSVPPGKVRFTIFDPVGLGENFAAFMHLADYHELLVTSRIWTEAPQIEQRLTDLQTHMENVIQKYLRNEFETIEQYNAHAGEVAEPFRVLVAANFPTNFNESAARRLASIVSTGARCGVYALVSLDAKVPFPTGCQLKDLEPHCVNIHWKEGRLQWRNPHFGRFPLALDAPPDPGTFSRILHVVGEKARDANRVEVPFQFIAPPKEAYWTSDSRGGVDVPLGRAGATKLQSLALGKGTSQHVLIAGKTGSGKSTLLHALITNAALRYSPDEIELYLIDFKKGVEFKVYAALELPHAKVIAVESEREFGLSVLQRLDLELKRRGDLYRAAGVQDLKGFRDARPDLSMPRILLIVDEFQEFFVEDDKIAQDVSLLLDRLVRQGRAFGIHVSLGSQTLGGAYSLARATLGQMAVRIALQCSEADAHLILSEDNTAARLLTRPGEAIYNDANGLIEGNNLFQVVWLSDEQREGYLRDIQQLARDRHRPPVSPLVFEGNLPAVPTKNPLLGTLLEALAWPDPPRFEQAWLGDAIAIKDPTSAVFRPQSGSNLLIVGQNDEAALAMLIMAGLSIAVQHPPRASGLKFHLLDGSPVDSALSGELAKLERYIPHPVKNVHLRELTKVIGEIASEVELRRDADALDQAPIYLLIYDIQRFRDLRKGDDDFGFSSSFGEDKPVSAAKSFLTILKDGPVVGVHTIVWCDSVNNLNRTFDRQGLREFELRVLFQMSANDSSALFDSPAAAKLGPNRALFYSEEENRIEKFRPYGLPDPAWLDQIARQLRSRPKPQAVAVPSEDGNGQTTPLTTAPETL
ncbi:MAG: FtsK/SpoIIIE domain-containing protein [Isosphaeraceae bacterium]